MSRQLNKNEPYKISSYWQARPETHAQCVQRLKSFLTRMTEWPEGINKWYPTGYSLKQAMDQSQYTPQDENKLYMNFCSSCKKEDILQNQIGFRFAAWNKQPESEKSAGLTIHCGSNTTLVGFPKYQNNCLFDLPLSLECIDDLEVMRLIIHDIAAIWQVDYLMIYQWSARELMPDDKEKFCVDYILYLSNEVFQISNIEDHNVTVEDFVNKGILIINNRKSSNGVLNEAIINLDKYVSEKQQ